MRKLHLIIPCFFLSILTYSANACHFSMTDKTTSTAKRIEDRLSVEQLATHDQRHKSAAIDGNIFKAVWNVPRNGCQSKFGVDLELESYGIEVNAVGTQWNGKAVTIFYNEAIGLYPAYEENSQGDVVKINAGLPQLTNLTQHFEKATSDIITEIPDPDFTGLAVIDWEKWFPQWDFPGEIMDYYRAPSIQLVRERHPEWDEATVELVAKLEYEQAAKALMEGTLILGKRLRPHGQWGFYHHPYCYSKKDGTRGCNSKVQQLNDYIPWLFRHTTAYYPSIYLSDDAANNSAFVEARLEEAMRIREEIGDVKTQDMFAYCRFNYTDTNLHYNLEDKQFQDEVHGVIKIPPYCSKIINTPVFQRLRSIKQLGGAEYVYPGTTHTRFSHCLGVCHLAQRVMKQLKESQPKAMRQDPEIAINDDDEKCVVLAGLCHGLGHGPLSHKFEDVVNKVEPPETKAETWTHEKMSVEILKKLEDKFDFSDNLTRDEVRNRIGDLIRGKPEKIGGHTEECGNGETCGRLVKSCEIYREIEDSRLAKDLQKRWEHYEKKRYLYQIISNSDNGIDVDKWEYLLRDCRNIGVTMNFDHDRVIDNMKVLPCKRTIVDPDSNKTTQCRQVGGRIHPGQQLHTYEVCFRDRVTIAIRDMFQSRWQIHEQVCRHHVVMIIEYMFTEVMIKYFRANKELREQIERDYHIKKEVGVEGWLMSAEGHLNAINGSIPTICEIKSNVDVYLKMTDCILDEIDRSSREDLQPAKQILDSIKIRKIYPLIGRITKQTKLWKLHRNTPNDGRDSETVEQQLIQTLCDCFSQEEADIAEIFEEDNLVVLKHRLDYGKKDSLTQTFFYEKRDLEGRKLPEDKRPKNFEETVESESYYVYSRREIEPAEKRKLIRRLVEELDYATPDENQNQQSRKNGMQSRHGKHNQVHQRRFGLSTSKWYRPSGDKNDNSRPATNPALNDLTREERRARKTSLPARMAVHFM